MEIGLVKFFYLNKRAIIYNYKTKETKRLMYIHYKIQKVSISNRQLVKKSPIVCKLTELV